MGALFKRVLDSFSEGFLRRLLMGAGLTLSANLVLSTVINHLLNSFIGDFMQLGSLSALVGVSGLHECISIVFSAFIAVAMMSSSNLTLKKIAK